MSINNSFYVRIPDEEKVALNQDVIDKADPSWNNFIKLSNTNILSKVKNAVLKCFTGSDWISIPGNISIKRDLMETLEIFDLTDEASNDLLLGKAVNSVFNQIYSKLLKSNNLDKMEKVIILLMKNYKLIDSDIIKSRHISKALGKKNKALLSLISLINPDHYLRYLEAREQAEKDPDVIQDDEITIKLWDAFLNSWVE